MKRNRHSARAGQAGFTMIEMAVVILLIAIVAAIAMPQFIPLLAFGEHESAARQLASFGDAAMAHVTLRRENITVLIDLDNQILTATHLADPEAIAEGEGEGEFLDPETEDALALLDQYRAQITGRGGMSSNSTLSRDGASREPQLGKRTRAGIDPQEVITRINAKFDNMANSQLEARARNVRRPDFLAEVEPLFDKSNSFSLDTDRPLEEMPVDDPLLGDTQLSESTKIESVWVDGAEFRRGVVAIELSPLGLQQLVGLYLKSEDGDYYTIVWDPLNGNTDVIAGQQRLG